ncbi:MAG TPA: sporulation protein YqfD [Bacillota bacterium]|jgi:similar to stage IV sporulation protein
MVVFRVIAYLIGYLTIRVEGQSPERLVNLAVQAGIPVWQVVAGRHVLWMKVPARNFADLHHLARKGRVLVHIEDRHGLPFSARRVLNRQGLVVGVFLFLVGLFALSSFVWSVEVTGLETLPLDVVTQAAARLGLKPGVLKRSVDFHVVETGLVLEVREISWAALEIHGTRAVLAVAEKALPPAEAPATPPAHVVANKDGLVEEVLALKGVPLVGRGQTVTAGQILISGLIGLSAEEQLGLVEPHKLPGGLPPLTRLVHAAGIIRARVWYHGQAEAFLTRVIRLRTGRARTRVLIKIGQQEIIVKGQNDVPFQDYDRTETHRSVPIWRNIQIPVELTWITFHEVTTGEETVAPEVAEQEAKESATVQAMTRIPPGVRIIDVRPVIAAGEGKVSVGVTIETLEEIGRAEAIVP